MISQTCTSDLGEVTGIIEEKRVMGGSGAEPLTELDTSTDKFGNTRKHRVLSTAERQKHIVRTYEKAGKRSKAQRMSECGRFARWNMRDCGHQEPKLHRMHCELPNCQHPLCIKYRTSKRFQEMHRRAKLAAAKNMPSGWRWKMLTLTLRSGRAADQGVSIPELRESALRIFRCWTELRTKILVPYVRRFCKLRGEDATSAKAFGGVASLEYGTNGAAHLHIMMLAPFLDERWLSRQWHLITGDSFVVDIREIRGKSRRGQSALRAGMKEVIKYLAKSFGRGGVELQVPANAGVAVSSMRTQRTFGAMYGCPPKLIDCCPICGCISSTCSDPIRATDAVEMERHRAALARHLIRGANVCGFD